MRQENGDNSPNHTDSAQTVPSRIGGFTLFFLVLSPIWLFLMMVVSGVLFGAKG